MEPTGLQQIYSILERDSKNTTYKFALLRATAEIVQNYHHFCHSLAGNPGRIEIPMGLFVERWMIYYYPFMASEKFVPQQLGGEKRERIAFRDEFDAVIRMYGDHLEEPFAVFYDHIRNGRFPNEVRPLVVILARKIADTILGKPMRHIGQSVNKSPYSIFQKESRRKQIHENWNPEFSAMIDSFGTVSLPRIFHDAMFDYGDFFSGERSILAQWATFTRRVSGGNFKLEEIMEMYLRHPVIERDYQEAVKLYTAKIPEGLLCAWSGKPLNSENIHVDHLLPFSVTKSNDLWNLIPSFSAVNSDKRDKIPGPELIHSRKDAIIGNWELLRSTFPERFDREMKLGLLRGDEIGDWKNKAISRIMGRADFLINRKFHEAWTGPGIVESK